VGGEGDPLLKTKGFYRLIIEKYLWISKTYHWIDKGYNYKFKRLIQKNIDFVKVLC
jgi:hypothetical protein